MDEGCAAGEASGPRAWRCGSRSGQPSGCVGFALRANAGDTLSRSCARCRAKLFGRCERKTGIAPFERLVAKVMRHEPHRSARRVLWIADNGSSHRGQRAADRLRAKWPNIILVHTPVRASWLNQIEVYFSIVRRKLLAPNDFSTLANLKRDLIGFQPRYEKSAKPFEWTFTRRDLHDLLTKIKAKFERIAA